MNIDKCISKEVLRIGKNRIVRQYGVDDFSYDNPALISTDPFIVDYQGRKVELSSSINLDTQEEYAICVNRKPTFKLLTSGKISFVSWIKHPLINDVTSQELVTSWRGVFKYTKEDSANKTPGLRIPQLGAIYAFMSKAQQAKTKGIIVLPTGTGKTETMLSVLVANQCSKLLVTVPSDALREQISDKFITLGVLPTFDIVDKGCALPYVAIIKESMSLKDWNTFIDKANVIVTTMPLISQSENDVSELLSKRCSHLFVDEAHHSEATTWSNFIDSFDDKKVTLFTATPFRNDGKKLKGDFIYNFSLKEAQEQGYYKPIKLLPVREYDSALADKAIAQAAVMQLKADLEKGFDHILMARCSSMKRAHEVFESYKNYSEYQPIIITSSSEKKASILKEIKAKQHRIIICVNMLGEGFDLPELKIAAIHDTRQSIAITLQFIGRFTRTSHDSQLGKASFIINLANPPIEEELFELYSRDADWNALLPILNDDTTKKEIDLNNYVLSFKGMEESKVPFQNITPALSTIAYRVGKTWRPRFWMDFFPEDQFTYRYGSTNEASDTLVIILGSIENVAWGNVNTIQNLTWNIVIVHRYSTPQYSHAYVNSTFPIDTDRFLEGLFGSDSIERICGNDIFRVLSDVKRLAVVNFGGRKGRLGNISFKSYYGKDVQEGITMTEERQLIKNNLFGNGFRAGERVSIGCSTKGKVWSYMTGNLLEYQEWARHIGKLLKDTSINPDDVLNNTIRPEIVDSIPQVVPIVIDWNPTLYTKYQESNIIIRIDSIDYLLSDVSIKLCNYSINDYVDYEITVDKNTSRFRLTIVDNKDGNKRYAIHQISGQKLGLAYGGHRYEDICDYFCQNDSAPIICFANGAELVGNLLHSVNETIIPFPVEELKPLNWQGVSLEKESQRVFPYRKDSIQYSFAERIKEQFDVLFDDDGSGEIADLIGIKDHDNEIHIHLYHLKYAHEGKINNQVSNFYEVCGQAQKCLKWREREKNRDFFTHLLKRKIKTYEGNTCPRILKGTETELERLSQQVNWKKAIKMHIAIVQPSLSKANAGKDILNLLGAVKSYIKDISNIDLEVYCNE